jgi:hypothetical protein
MSIADGSAPCTCAAPAGLSIGLHRLDIRHAYDRGHLDRYRHRGGRDEPDRQHVVQVEDWRDRRLRQPAQKIANPGFESGSASWSASPAVIGGSA